jgi:hypothetical protein
MIENTSSRLACAILLALALPVAAHAQAARTFVSASGSDTNDCSRSAPCRTFAVAITKTGAGGEIDVLNPAGYGPVNITKSISIVNDGVGSAGVLVPPGGTGITINAGPADVVNLRGLIIEGVSSTDGGIAFNTGSSLIIEHCVIRNAAFNAIDFNPNASSSLTVSSTLIADNGGRAFSVFPSGTGTVSLSLNGVAMHNNGDGVTLAGLSSTGTINAAITDSVLNLGNTGLYVESSATQAPVSVVLDRSVVSNNANGIFVFGVGTTVRLSRSVVSGNGSGWFTTISGVVQSYGNNYIDGNTSNETAPPAIGGK